MKVQLTALFFLLAAAQGRRSAPPPPKKFLAPQSYAFGLDERVIEELDTKEVKEVGHVQKPKEMDEKVPFVTQKRKMIMNIDSLNEAHGVGCF